MLVPRAVIMVYFIPAPGMSVLILKRLWSATKKLIS